jgi:hypothetical protein
MYVQFLPTVGDISFCAEYNVPEHTVYTPYAFHNNLLVDPQTQPQAPLVNFKIRRATTTDDGGFQATMEAYADAQHLWTHTATVQKNNARNYDKTTYTLN